MAQVFIGMPVYNGERYLREAIDSIRGQNYTDWTLFISDDASNDKTPEIAREYAGKDERIVYRRHEKNLGMFPNFKFTLDEASGEYFMWAAQDDIREKNYLRVCVEELERNKNLGLATTRLAAIDSFGRTLIEELELIKLSGKPGLASVTRYIMQPEILGKCNLMYGLFRTVAARATWQAYPQRHVWGQDYMFSLALVARFEIYVDERIIYKKRLGGVSSPAATADDQENTVKKLEYREPKNHIFPFGRFWSYFRGHVEALSGTPYVLLSALLFLRLPRALLIHVKERSFKNWIKRAINRSWR